MSAPDAPAEPPAGGPGQTLFEFVRHWSRRWHEPGAGALARRGRHALVTEAVRSLERRGTATINDVAREIGIDQSGASRLVKEAVAAGCLETAPAAADGRRRQVSVTAAGHEMLRAAHRWQEEMFERLTEGWTPREREEFHRSMLRLLSRSHTLSP